jgi:dihydroorotase
MYDLPTTLSKFLNLGLTLPQVIERATVSAARAMGRPDLGTLRIGAPADLALFRLEEGDYTFYDVFMAARKGTRRLVNTLTVMGGRPLAKEEPSPLQPWAQLPAEQQAVLRG